MFQVSSSVLLEALHAQYDPHTLGKGRAYQRQGRVRHYVASPLPGGLLISAEVRGSAPDPYEVDVEIEFDESGALGIYGECSCPMEAECKHVTATLLHYLEQPPELFSPNEIHAGIPSRRSARGPVLQLDVQLQTWLDQLQIAVTPPAPVNEVSEEPERLLYILKLESNQLRVESIVVRKLKAGNYGQPRNYYLSNILNSYQPAKFIRPEDIIIVRKLKVAQPMGGYTDYLSASWGAEILTEILATGRCHFRGSGKNHPPLTLGAARPAKAIWLANETGQQRPAFEVTPAVGEILPLSPPWYIDETTATCGALDTGWPDAVASAWLSAPPLPPDQAALLAEVLTQRHTTITFPEPRKVEVENLTRLKPIPCLRFYSARLKSNHWAYSWNRTRDEDDEFNFATFEFDYGGHRASMESSPQIIEQFCDGKLRRIMRDLKEEQSLLNQLTALGLHPVQHVLFNYELGKHSRNLTLREPEQWFDFCHIRVPMLREKGWQIVMDESFRFRIAEPESWYADAKALNGGNDWFGVELGVTLEGEKLNLLPVLVQFFQTSPRALNAETLAAMRDDAVVPIPLPDGRTLGFPAKRLREMMGVLLELLDADALNKRGQLKLNKLRAAELSSIAGDADWRWLGQKELRELSDKLRNFDGIKSVAPSEDLQATLRHYQQEGLSWLQFLREYSLAGILADDMGLGKTVQALAHLLLEKESGRMDRPSLVIAPTSLMTNWRQESARFAPNLKVLVLHGLDRKQHFEKISDHDLIVTSYSLLPRDHAILLENEFHCVILDEAQFIKNPKTQYAQIACQLKARHHICLTGTPMENHLGELWSLFNFLLPGFLGDDQRFNTIFRRPIEKGKNDDRRKLLARRVAPFILRRRKEEVLKELPPKTEIVQNVELAGPQRDLYESIRLAMHERVKAEVDKKGINRAQIIILDALLKLRQVCCDPRLLSLPSAQKVKQSAKLELLMDLLPEMIAEGRRILLFSQFTSMLALIEQELAKAKIDYVILTGQTTDRATPVQRFQSQEVPLFLISLKAGGTGLNLTAADTVIHYDPWWNPAVENQATDRAHRIGQEKNVFVYKLLTVGTVEEKIAALQARKRELVEGLLNEERKENLKMTQEDLDVLFAPIG